MNKMEIKMQKVLNVKDIICVVLITFSFNFCFSQIKIDGKFNIKQKLNNLNENYTFTKKGVFKYQSSGDLGVISYGKGCYFVKNDSLFLNYNLTKLKSESYFKIKKYYNDKDSIKINLNIYNFKKQPLHNIMVYTFPNYQSTTSNKQGKAYLKFKKIKHKEKIELHLEGEFWSKQIIFLDTDVNYSIEVFMNKSIISGFGHPKAIKDQIKKYKISELNEKKITLIIESQKIILIKDEEFISK